MTKKKQNINYGEKFGDSGACHNELKATSSSLLTTL